MWVGNAAVLRGGSRVVTVAGDGACRVWDVATGAVLRTLEGHTDAVRTLVGRGFDPCGAPSVLGSPENLHGVLTCHATA